MNLSPALKGQRVTLRKPAIKDIDDRLQCGRNLEYIRMNGGDIKSIAPLTMEDAIRWFELVVSDKYHWTIEFQGRCIGTAALKVDMQNKRAAYVLDLFDTSKSGNGLGSEVTDLILDFAFNNLYLRKVNLKVLDCNKRIIARFEECGFMKEGIDREAVLVGNCWETEVIMSILEHEYRDRENQSLCQIL